MSKYLVSCQRLLNLTVIVFAAMLCMRITVNWTSLIVGLVVWVAAIICRVVSKQQVIVKPPLLYPLLGFILATAVVGAVHGGMIEALESLKTLRPMICYFWAYDAFARDQRLQATALAYALALQAVAGFYSVVQQVCNFHPWSFQYLQGTGFLGEPMPFAGQMQLFSLVAIGLLLRNGYRWLPGKLKMLPVFALVVAGTVLGAIFACERSAWLGFAIGLFVIASLVSWRLLLKLGAAAVVLGAVAWTTIPVFQKRLLPLLDWQHEVSTKARLTVWHKAWELFCQNPWFGCGVRNFPHVYFDEAVVPGQAPYLAHGHSNYMHILATMGVSGFIPYLWLLFASLRLAWVQAHAERIRDVLIGRALAFKRGLGLGMFGALISLAVAGAFEYNFGTGQVRLAEWFLLAMLVPVKTSLRAVAKPVPEKSARAKRERKRKAA